MATDERLETAMASSRPCAAEAATSASTARQHTDVATDD